MVEPLDEYVCGTCGVPVARKADNQIIHIDAIPEGMKEHDAFPWVTRREYLFGQTERQQAARAPQERGIAALERIADALEAIAQRLDR